MRRAQHLKCIRVLRLERFSMTEILELRAQGLEE